MFLPNKGITFFFHFVEPTNLGKKTINLGSMFIYLLPRNTGQNCGDYLKGVIILKKRLESSEFSTPSLIAGRDTARGYAE